MTVTITALDAGSRTISLRGRSGQTQTLPVGPEVTRLSEFAVGDLIEVEYEQGLELEYQPAGSADVPMEGGVTAGEPAGTSPRGAWPRRASRAP